MKTCGPDRLQPSILILTPAYPIPPTSGNLIDIESRLAFWHRQGWLVILVVCPTTVERADESVAKPTPYIVHWTESRERWPSREPASILARVQELIDQHQPAIIWCEYADLANLAARLRRNGAKLWFRAHNFELMHFLEKARQHHQERFGRMRSWLSTARELVAIATSMRRIAVTEWWMHRVADVVYYISPSDRAVMANLYPGPAERVWLPTFLPVSHRPTRMVGARVEVVYSGSDYENNLNRAGASELISDIIPRVRADAPEVFRFHIVGRHAENWFRKDAATDVIIHGFVDDYASFLSTMDIACLPIRFGRGCKLKMLEAMAAGVPVVGYHAVFRGIPENPASYTSARDAVALVAALILLADKTERVRVATIGQELYANWRAVAENDLIRRAEVISRHWTK